MHQKFNNENTTAYFYCLPTLLVGCVSISLRKNQEKVPFVWEAASVYFLMTDRSIMEINQMMSISTEPKLPENWF
jgi:hypothetical protein